MSATTACRPGSSLSRGPPTFRYATRCRSQKRTASRTDRPDAGSRTRRGQATPAVRGRTVLPPRRRRRARISTPSARRRLRSVRSMGRRVGVGTSGQLEASGPASVQRPPGHQPVMGTPQARAASSAPWSAPVCPPDTSTRGRRVARSPRRTAEPGRRVRNMELCDEGRKPSLCESAVSGCVQVLREMAAQLVGNGHGAHGALISMDPDDAAA